MLVAIADTHAIIWYLLNDPRLSDRGRQVFEDAAGTGDQVGISSISFVELVYLEEKNRVTPGILDLLYSALEQPDPLLVEFFVDRTITRIMREIPRLEVPDMPDRVISASAVTHDVPVITRDQRIAASSVPNIW
jgi:PIN domain nuclease of toxin-antitoxin system